MSKAYSQSPLDNRRRQSKETIEGEKNKRKKKVIKTETRGWGEGRNMVPYNESVMKAAEKAGRDCHRDAGSNQAPGEPRGGVVVAF